VSNLWDIDTRRALAALATVIGVILLLAAGAGAAEQRLVDPGVEAPMPTEGSLESPESDSPPASDPGSPAGAEAPASGAGAPASANPAPASVGARPTGAAATAPAAASSVLAETTVAVAEPRSFRIVAPARPASDDSPLSLPTAEPFGVVLAAAVLLLIGAGVGHAWAHASGRLDAAI
jgi:hypothetical protein